jgi:hypothetical protein
MVASRFSERIEDDMDQITKGLTGVCRASARTAALALAFAVPAAADGWGDTPYVPTPQNVVDTMLEIAKVGPKDFVVDLGSGDGRIVITAATQFGARGFGVDIDPRLVKLSNELAAKAGIADRAVFYERDLYHTDISQASVLTLYLLPEVVLMIRPKVLSTLRPGTRVVSHDYDFGEWQPDYQIVVDAPGKPVGREQTSKIMYWVVPAEASGRWQWRMKDAAGAVGDFELALKQMFQKVEGTLSAGGKRVPIEDVSLTGERLAFAARLGEGAGAVRYEFNGRISGNAIEGSIRAAGAGAGAAQQVWNAARTEVWEPGHRALPAPTLMPR